MSVLSRVLLILPITACGLDPLYEAGGDDLDKYGVEIKDTAYGIDLREVQVVFPPSLQQLFMNANVSHLLMGVPEQGVSTFRTFAAASTPAGEQDICATTTELALARWNGPGEFVIEGGRFFLPLAGEAVRFDSTQFDGIITADGDWSPLDIHARVDIRELSGVLADGEDPCAIEAACVPCEDGQRLCLEVDMSTDAWLLDLDFDPRPDCGEP